MRKVVILILALLLPAGIFVFLKMFGKNEFDVPVFYQSDAPPAACDIDYQVPYFVPDSIMKKLTGRTTSESVLVNFYDSIRVSPRVTEAFSPAEVLVVDLSSLDSQKTFLERCVFFLQDDAKKLVLIDSQNAIRGYYDGTEREEVDRLILELNILLEKY